VRRAGRLSTLVFETFEARLEIHIPESFVAANEPNPGKVGWYRIS
jgi:hypothetical protein